MTKRITIDPATPWLDRTAAFSALVRDVKAELAEGETYSYAGGNRINVPDRVAAALGLDGSELNAQARDVEIATGGPADVAQRAAEEVERARGIAPERPDAETAKRVEKARTAKKAAATKRATKKATPRKRTTAKKSTAKKAAARSTTKKG